MHTAEGCLINTYSTKTYPVLWRSTLPLVSLHHSTGHSEEITSLHVLQWKSGTVV